MPNIRRSYSGLGSAYGTLAIFVLSGRLLDGHWTRTLCYFLPCFESSSSPAQPVPSSPTLSLVRRTSSPTTHYQKALPAVTMALPTKTKCWLMARAPTGLPTYSGENPTFVLELRDLPEVKTGQILVEALYLSNDPSQRTWMSALVPEKRLHSKISSYSHGLYRMPSSTNIKYFQRF